MTTDCHDTAVATLSCVIDSERPTTWIEAATAAHEHLLDALDALVAADALDVTAPSRLPSWTLGHVITHVTHSGDGHVRMLDSAARGAVGVQYPGGVEGRNAAIESGADRAAVAQVEGLRCSCAQLEQRWSTMSDWTGRGGTVRFEVHVVDLPFLRLRETAIHHVDLDIGYEFDDLPSEYVREELGRMEMLWAARQPMGMTKLPAAALAATPARRLAWLMGRATIDGIAPADTF